MISDFGKDFGGKPLSENTDFFEKTIIYKNQFYNVGNRKDNQIELYYGKSFHSTVLLKDCRLFRLSPKQYSKCNEFLWHEGEATK